MTLRVLHVGKFYPPYRGGMEVFLADLVTTQRAGGLDAAALVHGEPAPDDPPWLVRVPVHFSLLYAPIALGFRAALARAIRQFKPDILHLHFPNNSALWVLTLPQARAIPWVVHWHSDVVLSNIKWSVAAAYALYRPFEQAVLDGAERVIATSQPYLDASEPLRRWHSKCAVVPLGLRTDLLPPPRRNPHSAAHAHAHAHAHTHAGAGAGAGAGAAEKAADAHPLWSPAAQLRILSIGRLTYYKGFETLIDAVQQLPGVELLIAGEGELHAALQARIASAGARPAVAGAIAPQLLGDVSEAQKHELLASCDVFCLASRERTEAFGVVLLEAMHHARACIVADLPGSGMPWVVAQSHVGLRVPIEDVEAWRSAITRLQHDPGLRQRLGNAGPLALARFFGMTACARAVEREYRHIVPAAQQRAPLGRPLAVIATHNHAQGIAALVLQLKHNGLPDVLVIDHRSIDGTCSQARAAGAQVLSPLLAQSRWGAVQTGLRYALHRGYSGVVTVDANQPPHQRAIPLLLEHAAHADVTLACPPAAENRPALPAGWFQRLSGLPLRTPHSGLRHYSVQALSTLTARNAMLLDQADLEVLLLARDAGLRILEIPVPAPLAQHHAARKSRLAALRYHTATALLCLARWKITGRS